MYHQHQVLLVVLAVLWHLVHLFDQDFLQVHLGQQDLMVQVAQLVQLDHFLLSLL